ncbi:MAG: hypothetical protein QOJ40_1394 [Verrucomicrobiota bacterium]
MMFAEKNEGCRGGTETHATNPEAMRIVLRNTETGAYFKTSTEWTQDPKEALNFAFTGSAIEAARAMNFRNIEIVKLGDDGKEFSGERVAPEQP